MVEALSPEQQQRLTSTLERQRAAADPARSAWVSANAGSGKTTVLTNRVTRLLLQGTQPSRILCLTYTKAAASEMANRLFEQLGEWATLPDDKLALKIAELEDGAVGGDKLKSARRLFARALETPGGLKIQTIHAFCQSLLSRFPIEAGVPPHFQVLEGRMGETILEEARAKAFEQAESGRDKPLSAAKTHLVERLDHPGLLATLESFLSERGKIERWLAVHGGVAPAFKALRTARGLEGQNADDLIRSTLDHADGLRGELGEAGAILKQGSKSEIALAGKLEAALGVLKTSYDFDTYKSVFVTQKNTPVKTLLTKKGQTDYPHIEDLLRGEQNRIVAVDQDLRLLQAIEASEALFIFGQAMFEAYSRLKQENGLLDYQDLIEHTSKLLEDRAESAWVLFKLDGGIDHILVDEAQDTSPDQWSVIERLAQGFFVDVSGHLQKDDGQPRTVFAVGDEKQSIYSFQGADPAAFGSMRAYFKEQVEAAEHYFADVELVLSFRSVTQVLDAVDQVFEDEDASRGLTFEGRRVQHEAFRLAQAGLVEIWPTIKPEEDVPTDPWDAPLDRPSKYSPRAQLAAGIAARIADWLTRGEPVSPSGSPITPGDILVLVQRRNSFVDELIRALKARNIPVAGRDRMVLTDQLAVMDLIAMGECALLPEDDLMLATVLRGPLIGLSEDGLFDLAHDRPGSLWSALQLATSPIFAEATETLKQILARVETMPPYEFYAHLLGSAAADHTSGREKMIARLGFESADPLDEFMTLALEYERNETPTLQGFIHWIKRDASEIKREFEHGANEVRIMTVHGAKGLEAPIVFLPDTCAVPGGATDADIVDIGDGAGDGFLWRVARTNDQDALTAAARERIADRRAEEYRRLLYVAMTRARDRLYVAGYETKRGLPEGCWHGLIERALETAWVEHSYEDGQFAYRIAPSEWAEIDAGTWTYDKRQLPAPPHVPSKTDLPAWAFDVLAPEAVKQTQAPSQLGLDEDEAFEPPVASPGDEAAVDRFLRGNLIHRLLEILPEHSPDQRQSVARRYLSEPAFELEDQAAQALEEEVFEILNHPEFGSLFAPGSIAEAPLSGTLPGTDIVINGQVDRLAFRGNDVLVIDYKTNRPPPADAAHVPDLYIRQMAAYRGLLQAIYPDKTIRCALLWTDDARLMELPKAALNAAYAKIQGL